MAAKRIQRSRVAKVAKQALEIANEVVAFDDHVLYMSSSAADRSDDFCWHFGSGVFGSGIYDSGSDFESDAAYVRDVLNGTTDEWQGPAHAIGLKSGKNVVGWMIVGRNPGATPFSPDDERLLTSVGFLAGQSLRGNNSLELMQRLYLQFVNRRTHLLHLDRKESLLREYSDKAIAVLHPELTKTPRAHIVRTTTKLPTTNRQLLYIADAASTRARDWTKSKRQTRYEVVPNDSVAADTFLNGVPYLVNNYNSHVPSGRRLFHNTTRHISAPIAAAGGLCHGVLSIETNRAQQYTNSHLHALALLAGHLARPLRSALYFELAEQRQVDQVQIVADTMRSFHDCGSISSLHKSLIQGLRKLLYHRGLICRVNHEQRRVIGEHSWGPKMKELKTSTVRSFDADAGDCQILAVTDRQPQLITNPVTDPRAHSDAVITAKLAPFVVIPIVGIDQRVNWTLHLERKDTAPIGDPEVAALQEICRAAAGVEHRIRVDADRKRSAQLDALSLDWAHRLQRRSPKQRRARLFEELCKFLVESSLCSRCRAFEINGDKQRGLVCFPDDLPKFSGMPIYYKQASRQVLDRLRSDRRPLIVFNRNLVGSVKSGGDYVAMSSSSPHKVPLKKEDVSEWVEFPLFARGNLVAKVVVDRKGSADGVAYDTTEIAAIETIANLTSLALDSDVLHRELVQEAAIGVSMGVFRHEIDGVINRLRHSSIDVARLDTDILREKLPGEYVFTLESLLNMLDAADRRVQKIRTFFKQEVIRRSAASARPLMATTEIREAIDLLGHVPGDIIVSEGDSHFPVARKHRPLCLILLQLLQNALKALDKSENGGKIVVKCAKSVEGHSLTVINPGPCLTEQQLQSLKSDRYWDWGADPELGLGLMHAKLIADSTDWKLTLDYSRGGKTAFTVTMPRKAPL